MGMARPSRIAWLFNILGIILLNVSLDVLSACVHVDFSSGYPVFDEQAVQTACDNVSMLAACSYEADSTFDGAQLEHLLGVSAGQSISAHDLISFFHRLSCKKKMAYLNDAYAHGR